MKMHPCIVYLPTFGWSYLDAAGHCRADATPPDQYRRWTAAPLDYHPTAVWPQFVYPTADTALEASRTSDFSRWYRFEDAALFLWSPNHPDVAQDVVTGRWMFEVQTLNHDGWYFSEDTYTTEEEAHLATLAYNTKYNNY